MLEICSLLSAYSTSVRYIFTILAQSKRPFVVGLLQT